MKKAPWNKGLHIKSNNALEEWRKNGGTHKGRKAPWMVGRQISEKTRIKLRESKLGIKNPRYGKTGKESPVWKGDTAGYHAIHKWLESHIKKEGSCKSCDAIIKTHWANYSGKYKRDIQDFIELCVKCHSAFDRNREILI